MDEATAPDASQGSVVVTWWSAADVDDELLTDLVASFAEVPVDTVDIVHACRTCGSDQHGRPVVRWDGQASPWHLSLGRAGDVSVVAVSDAGPVGVDVETGRPGSDRTTWVRTESLVKATGHGLTVDPGTIALTAPTAAPDLLAWPLPEPVGAPVWMSDLEAPAGYVAAVTVLGDARPQVVTAWGAPGG